MNEVDKLLLELQDEIASIGEEKWQIVVEQHPEWVKLLRAYLVQYKSVVDVEEFKIFYSLIFGRELPKIQVPIVAAFVRAFHEKRGVMEECWRGFGKSTLLTAWAAYIIGARPVGSTIVVRINDSAAKETGKAIAQLIEINPGWKKMFPHVVPDKEAGWSGESGYFVRDTRIEDYGKWRQMCFADHLAEPSLVCGGVESGIIIGKHPTNGAWFDDLHDEDNTRSTLEMKRVVDILDGNIIETWSGAGGSPAVGVACTPWNEKDAYNRMMKTGIFEKVSIPIFVRADSFDSGEYDNHPCYEIWLESKRLGKQMFEPYGYEVYLTWPENFPMEIIMQRYNKNPARFGQMSLLDLSTLKGLVLQKEWLNEYPADKIGAHWRTYIGVDFASTTDKLPANTIDYFALAIGKEIPSGGLVITGGIRARLSKAEALKKVSLYNNLYNPFGVGIEKLGSGKQFIEDFINLPEVPVVSLPHKGMGKLKSKGEKFESVLGTDFAMGRIWISDVKDDFLNAFCDEWVSWDGEKSRTGHDDALDAVYMLRETGLSTMRKAQKNEKPENSGERKLSAFAKVGTHAG